ncbi:MAG: type III pantothenate kinase [Flavobacteriaceae bacterium]|nr:type III pantothenate kinase [Flavobacteriaceae bacterium]
MNLVIDIGNTQGKAAVFRKEVLLEKVIFAKNDLLKVLNKFYKEHPIKKGILSSVAGLEEETYTAIRNEYNFIFLGSETKVPFENLYKTPKTLGVDRIALMSAAAVQFPKLPVLVIDAGTCITYDLLTEENKYFGGAISPGIDMRYKALHQFTANLPLLTKEDEIPAIGDTTKSAMHSGVLNGIVLEIEGIIAQQINKNKKLTVILTGGDTNFLSKKLKSTIFAKPNFLLEGLNSILIHNFEE